MIELISTLLTDAKLAGVNLTFKPASEGRISAVMSFIADSVDSMKHYQKDNDTEAAYITLKSKLAIPLVITDTPENIEDKLTQAIGNLRDAVSDVTSTMNALDLSGELAKAATQAKSKTKHQKKAEKSPATTTTSSSDNTDTTAEAVDTDPEAQPPQRDDGGDDYNDLECL